MNIREGKSIQDGTPTPDNPVEIKSINLFEVNGIQYQDNIPSNYLIGITKEQFCKYEQLQQERDKYKSIVYKIKIFIYVNIEILEYDEKVKEVEILNKVLNKLKELEEDKENE